MDVDRRVAEIVADAIPGARAVRLAGTGHMAPLTHPQLVLRVIREHLVEASVA